MCCDRSALRSALTVLEEPNKMLVLKERMIEKQKQKQLKQKEDKGNSQLCFVICVGLVAHMNFIRLSTIRLSISC